MKILPGRDRILRLFLAPETCDSITRRAAMAREWALLQLSRQAFLLGHRVLVVGAKAYWAGIVGRRGLRWVLRMSWRLDLLGMRLMRRSIARRAGRYG